MYTLKHLAIVVLLPFLGCGTSNAAKLSPFDDAVAVWHMAEDSTQDKEQFRLKIHGDVKLGIELEENEQKASLRRNGDGRVADFEGGYLTVGEKAAHALRLNGNKMTFCMRVNFGKGLLTTPLFGRLAPDDPFSNILYPAPLNMPTVGYPQLNRIKEGNALEFLWRTTPLKERVKPEYYNEEEPTGWFKFLLDGEKKHTMIKEGDLISGVLRQQVPINLIGKNRWHDVIIRFNREKLETFVDGVLLNTDWPHGDLYKFEGPFLIGAGFRDGKLLTGFHGLIDHVAIWDRPLTDKEITLLSGGEKEAAKRDIDILGPIVPVGQYWRPRSYNMFVGDCMTFAHDGVFHVFFLSDRGHGTGKWGTLGSPWGHVSTTDFVNWQEHPSPLDITEPWECCLGTGSFAYHDGKYYLFYIKHDRRAWFTDNPNQGDTIFMATSDDCINFKKETEPLFVPKFFNINDVNPDIYPNETEGGYMLSLSNWKVWKTNDFKTWEERDTLSTPPWWICTSYFKWNDWYYFSSCSLYWRSKKPIEADTTWTMPAHHALRGGIRVPQISKFKDRYIIAGFTPEPRGTAYAGELLVREVIQNPDGTLATKWIEEMIPASCEPLDLPFKKSTGNSSKDGSNIQVSAPDGFAVGMLDEVPQNVRITLQVKPEEGVKHFGLCFRGKGEYESGCELQFDTAKQRVQFAPVSNGRMAEEAGHWMAITGVTGIDKPFTLDIIVKDDLVDACIDNRRTIITRNYTKLAGGRLFFFANKGQVTFENIQVRPLLVK
jgi:hypothetical protein